MPAKRASSSLSGGTGDVNPQTFVIAVTQAAVNTCQSITIPLPVPKYPGQNNRAIVFELLKAKWMLDNLPQPAAANISITGYLRTSAFPFADGTAMTEAQTFQTRIDPRTISTVSVDGVFFTAAGFAFGDRDKEIDFTDAAGHGLLVATDQVTLSINSLNLAAVGSWGVRMEYRLKEVGLAEYIGIVQSQQ